jgi:hypothetical protein
MCGHQITFYNLLTDTFEMVTECEEGGGFRFVVSYHFEPNMRAAGDRSLPSRVKRLAQETVTLATSLPLSYSSSVFVRCDADRLDVMKVGSLQCTHVEPLVIQVHVHIFSLISGGKMPQLH